MVRAEQLIDAVPPRGWLALGVLALGVVLGILVGRLVRRLLVRTGVPGTIEGTSFERTARDLGTSTVTLIGKLSTYFIVGVALFAALSVAEIGYTDRFWNVVVSFLPQLFFAIFVLIVGVVLGDKTELLVAERLSDVKIPQTGIIPLLAKYSVFYVAVLVALSQVGVATLALLVLLGAYFFALVVFGVVAFKDLLTSGAAGVYLLFHQPFSIGDEVELGAHRGVVQEIDLFVTHVESDGEEYIVPNSKVFREGLVRIRS